MEGKTMQENAMMQRATDSVVLGIFSMMLSCAVFLLKRRPKPAMAIVRRTEVQSQPQGV
jgi:hypothetical protein